MKNIENASVEELSRVIPKNAAEAVYASFHGDKEETK